MSVEQVILEAFHEALEMRGKPAKVALDDQSVLLESGLDSLGFAILVTNLEDKLGYDPFQIMESAYYPRTYKEFVDIYIKYKPK